MAEMLFHTFFITIGRLAHSYHVDDFHVFQTVCLGDEFIGQALGFTTGMGKYDLLT